MKTRQRDSSSFDLFLDTICNTFGGIVFLAILLTIMIQNRAIIRTASDEASPLSAEQLREVTLKLDRLRVEKESLEATLESLPAPTSGSPVSEFIHASEKAKRKDSELSELLERQATMSQDLSEQLASNVEQRKANEKIPAELDDAKRRLEKATAEYATALESKQQTLRMPKVRTTQAASILVLIQNDELFVGFKPSILGDGFQSDQVTIESTLGSGIQIDPIDDMGTDLNTATGRAAFREIVQEASRAGHVITLAVWPESYDLFPSLKDRMVNEEVFYQLWPQSESELLVVFRGGSARRIQ